MGWFRAHDGISTDVKYPAIADRCGQPVERVIAVWLHVLDEANKPVTQRHATSHRATDRGEVHIDSETFASFLRCKPEDVEAILEAMQKPKRDGSCGMLDGNRVASWGKRNPLREDENAAERKRRQRSKAKERDAKPVPPGPKQSRTVTHGPALLDRQTEETDKKERKKDTAPNGAYRWSGKIIRLNEADFDQWAQSFHAVDLPANLLTIDAWLASNEASDQQRKKWFHLTGNTLRKRHQEALDDRARPNDWRLDPKQMHIPG